MTILPSESLIEGNWIIENNKLVADANSHRIQRLIDGGSLILVARSPDGWSVLYRDLADGRLWELTYPDSGLHGAGAPCLTLVSKEVASTNYSF